MRLRRPIQTRFRYGYPTRVNLATYHNSQAHSSKGTRSLHISPKADHAPTACRHTVSGTISRPLTGALFTFPSRYLFAIGHQGVFRLSRWSCQIHTRFLGPRATWEKLKRAVQISSTGVLPSTPDLSHVLRLPIRFLTRRPAGRPIKKNPTTP